MNLPPKVEEWTKEQVRQWLLTELKLDPKWTDKLYEEDVSGKELICYKTKDLHELGIKHGPAVRIVNTLEALQRSHENVPQSNVHAGISQTQSSSETPGCSRTEHAEEKPDLSSVKPDDLPVGASRKAKKSKKKSKKRSSPNPDTSKTSEHKDTNETSSGNITTQTKQLQAEEPRGGITENEPKETSTAWPSHLETKESKTKESSSTAPAQVTKGKSAGPKHIKMQDTNTEKPSGDKTHERKNRKPDGQCSFHPFDQQSVSHRYIENYCLPPESGPTNLTDPAHEYKFLGGAEDIHIMKKKINKEAFRFAAGCMNSRTNGTIHFGVADSKNTTFSHGEIIGVSLDETDVIIDHFNQGFRSYFEDNADDAKKCIRQPRFVEVLCSDRTSSGKYVIEVDVVPRHSVVHGKTFYTQTLEEENQWKKSKSKSLLIRDGAATRDICKIGNPRDLQAELAKVTADLNVLDTLRKEAEKKPDSKRKLNQGENLKNLLTCGGGALDHYDYYIIATNKSHSEQLQHLKFLTTLKLFSVLDFDPDSLVPATATGKTELLIFTRRDSSRGIQHR